MCFINTRLYFTVMKQLVTLLLVLSFVACTSPSQAEKDYNTTRTTLLDGHDVVMKDMMQINALIKKLEADSTLATQQAYHKTLADLKQAHELMFAWMHGLSEKFPNIGNAELQLTEEEYKAHTEKLKGYQNALDDVESRMITSIKNAKSLLGQE